MGNIRCLNCRSEITTISGMECPHCKAQLSHVKIAFLSYLGPEDSLAGYQRSYKLVLFKSIFELLKAGQAISVSRVSEVFRKYYLDRKSAGLPTDKEADKRISEIEQSDLRDIWLLISMNPFAAISKHGFLKVKGDGLNGVMVLQKGIDTLTNEEIDSILDIVEKKLVRYFESIGSKALVGSLVETVKAPEPEALPAQEPETVETEEDSCAVESELPLNVEAGTYANASGEILLEDLPLSTRAFNAFKRSGMSNLGQLRSCYCDGSISEIRNIGSTVIQEIGELLGKPVQGRELSTEPLCEQTELSSDGVLSGDMDEETKLLKIEEVFADNAFNLFRQYCERNGIFTIGELIGFPYNNLMNERGFGKGKMVKIVEKWASLLDGISTVQSNADQSELSAEPCIEIHESNLGFGIGLVSNFAGARKIHDLLAEAGIKTLGDINGYTRIALARKLQYEKLNSFMSALEHFKKPYSEVLEERIEQIADDRSFDVFARRAAGKTLQAVGEEFDLTRERVRQICSKKQRLIMPIIHPMIETLMQQNGARYFREEQIREFIDNEVYANAVMYTLRETESFKFFSSPLIFFETSSYPDVDRTLKELAFDIVGDGINIFESAEEIEKALDAAGFGFLNADDFLGLLIDLDFTFYGDYVLQDRKSYGRLCARIVEESFPDGISNTKEDMDRLRDLTKQQYGDLDLPDSDRSVYARICDYLILRGRSKYIAPGKVFVDEDILAQIKDYIDNSKQKDIFYSELYAEFEGLLTMLTNIDNHQFLHGVLRYYYPADYSYSRDFLSKETGEAGQSLADRITAYVTSVGAAMHKKDILRHFPGITEVVLFNTAYNFKGLLQWEFNYYNSLSNLHLTNEDVQAIDCVLSALIDANDGYCSEGMLLEKAQAELGSIVEKGAIRNSMNMFYTAQELLADKYVFRNPHIARIGRFQSMIGTDIAADLLGDKEVLSMKAFYKMTDRLKWSPVSAGVIFTEIEQRYIRTASDTYIRKDKFAVGDEDAEYLKRLFENQAEGNWYLPLQLFSDSEEELPCGLQVNEFLIGSASAVCDLGWHIVAPQIKDRRYQRGILVRNSEQVFTYDKLVSAVLKENGVAEISENDLLSFLMIRSLALRYIPKDLQTSALFRFAEGIYSVI